MAKISVQQAYETICNQLAEDNKSTSLTWLITGAPRSGKSTLALDLTVWAAQHIGSEHVSLIVTNRHVADEANRHIIHSLKVMGQRRLATTLSALAFRIIDERQLRQAGPAPKLLNGAEQTALLRAVLDHHIEHARLGDLCDTCMLLRSYFVGTTQQNSASTRDTVSLFESYITPTFLLQLRDMLARMNELGASHSLENEILDTLVSTPSTVMGASALDHSRIQIQLSYALRREYSAEIRAQYPDQLRFDSSRLLREAALTVQSNTDSDGVHYPSLIIVDDAQELTLAAMFLLHELYKTGTRIVFLGNPDESVLGFRGAYGEFFFNRADKKSVEEDETLFLPSDFACFDAQRIDLQSGLLYEDMDYKARVASRVALNIPATYATDIPMTLRAHKFPDSLDNISRIYDYDDQAVKDSSVDAHLFHSPREELNYILKQIVHMRMNGAQSWNSMAIIVHDNATARTFGRRLQDEGIPVRYSAIAKPLNEDPVTCGLFAAIELSRIKLEDSHSCDALNRRVERLMRQFASSPLGVSKDDKPMSMSHLDALFNAMSTMMQAAATAQVHVTYNFTAIRDAWNAIIQHYHTSGEDQPLHTTALRTLLILNTHEVRDKIITMLQAMDSEYSNDMQCLRRLLHMMDAVNAHASTNATDIIGILWAAWQAADVSDTWQKKALDFTNFSQRLRYNEWLDGAMRLFDYANQRDSSVSIDTFMVRVKNLDISADSLAHLAPLDEAITVTTPASTAGAQWDHVWMPGVQEGTWPNLTLRNTMLGADNLAEIMMTGSLRQQAHDRMIEVLHAEKRSFLVALMRARSTVHVSAVWNDEVSPSDFLYTYMPELCERVDKMDKADFTEVPLVQLAEQSCQDGLDAIGNTTISDVIRQARVTLSEELISADGLTQRGLDALDALSYLKNHGYSFAAPEKWAFVDRFEIDKMHEQAVSILEGTEEKPVYLSPSAVESLWGCPICYRLENRFSGPRASTAATSFGTLIHSIAQWASQDQHYDSAQFYNEQKDALGSSGAVVDAITDAMMEQYDAMKTPADIDNGIKEYMAELDNNRKAREILRNIASYFVYSHEADVAGGAANVDYHPAYAPITDAKAEWEFEADITLEDIRFAYNAIEGRTPVTAQEFEQIITMLADGMPEGFDYSTTVRLRGVIDRVEWHGQSENGQDVMYIVDYKTGKKAHNLNEQFNNLQLTCYQLGLIFSHKQHATDEQRARLFSEAPVIAMSSLFDVKHESIPATSRQEGFAKYQPALFVNGHLGYEYAGRPYNKQHSTMINSRLGIDSKILETMRPEVQERLADELDNFETDRTLHSLTLIARVFYAAAALRSDVLTVSAIHAPHNPQFCAYKHVCSACANSNTSVMEEWLS